MKPGDYTEVAVTRNNKCPATRGLSTVCNRPDGHAGEHADVSESGLVLEVWGSAGASGGALLTEARRKGLLRIVEALDEIAAAQDQAERVLRELKQEFAADALMKKVLDRTEVPYDDGTYPVESEDPDAWEAELEEYA
ncbi:hypothetical protein [Tsukamurella hominis]|uniref:hypothetical protein n=1 Tax=Tsukamurella hominis TaxID=1970232 RepID=UPI0039EBCBD8